MAARSDLERLALVESDLKAHSKTITALIEGQKSFDARLLILEQAEQNRKILEARQEERDIATLAWRKSVDDRFKNIGGNTTKLLWIVGTAVAVAFVNWILKGNLTI